MNVHAPALAEAQRFDEQTSPFADDVLDGLSQHPKRLSPKYFYDAAGSELFEQITLLPEYYPTRTELSILRERAGANIGDPPQGGGAVEFGAGATTKVRLLLEQCTLGAYVPVDISGDFLKAQADALRQDFPGLAVYTRRGRLHRAVCAARRGRRNAEGRLFSGIDDRQFRAA